MVIFGTGLATFLGIIPAAHAQQFAPHIGYIYPAGGQQGSTFEVTIGGQYLDGVTNVFVSGAGVQASVAEHVKPINVGQFNRLRDQLKALMDKKTAAFKSNWKRDGQGGSQAPAKVTWTPEDEKKVAEIMKKMSTFVRRPSSPAIAENVTVRITMARDAEPGERELRLATPLGLTNPLVFCVGQFSEFSETAAKIGGQPDISKRWKYGKQPQSSTPEPATETRITLPAIVNGQIMPHGADRARFQSQQGQQFTPGDVDRYRFQARQGEHLVVAVSARELIPYLADAVPGWFQATLALYDAKGKELAYDDDFRFHPDPVLHYKIPKDGEYVVEIKDAIYRGREDFVYRMALGDLPFITSIFPLGGQAGAQTTVELNGWNLPMDKIEMDAKDKAPGVYPLSVRRGKWISNRVPFAVDTLPECLEQEPNNQQDNAQKVSLPVIVNGRIDQPGDCDVFCFEGRAGGEVVAEVYARRLDSPLDSVLKLTDAVGKQLAFNDDHEDKGSGLNTHHADSWLRAALPANGTYYLYLGDVQRQGGPEYAYRLRISPPRHDFELRVVPSSISVRGGATVPITVYALRKDGFPDEIALTLKDAPGFTLSGAVVPANQDQVRLTLTAPPVPTKEPLNIHLEGRAMIQGREVVRPAVPADDMMQAFAYRHLVPAEDLEVAVSGRFMTKTQVKILTPTPVKIPAGGIARVQVGVPTRTFFGNLQLELNEPPEGITLQNAAPVGWGTEIVLQADAAKVKPGLKGNLIVNAFFAGKNSASSDKAKPQANVRRASMGTLPAIPFEIVAP
jgi:hypothetical protein